MIVNYRSEPLRERIKKFRREKGKEVDPADLFSSRVFGDPRYGPSMKKTAGVCLRNQCLPTAPPYTKDTPAITCDCASAKVLTKKATASTRTGCAGTTCSLIQIAGS